MAASVRKASPAIGAARWLTAAGALTVSRFARRHPLVSFALGLWLTYSSATTIATHLWQATATALTATTLGTTWRVLHPEHFHRNVTRRIRNSWRGWWVYRRNWQPAMTLSGLTKRLQGVEQLPARGPVVTVSGFDYLLVQMLPGQIFDDWATAAPRLAQSFGAQQCRVQRTNQPQVLQLVFLHTDSLSSGFAAPELDDVVDAEWLPVGATEFGRWYGLRLYGTHLLLAGATGAGKSEALWSILHALSPALGRDVQLWLLDPKGGQEFYAARNLCHVFAPLGDGSPAEFADRLEDAVSIMRERQAILRESGRKHEIGPEMPWIVLLIDEIASLTAYNLDRDAKKRFEAALNLLLSQGRACGITVIGALQDPRKEVLSMRDLFPTRIGLRMTESLHADMVLGDGARERGALCDQIAESTPGVAYVVHDGSAEVERIRFVYLDDDARTNLLRRVVAPATAPEDADDETRTAA